MRSRQLPGIWKAVSARIDGKQEIANDENPSYFVFRSDQTFKIIKRGRKPEGTWSQNGSELVLNATGEETKVAQIKRPSPDELELTMTEGGKQAVITYKRTDLTEEPTVDG